MSEGILVRANETVYYGEVRRRPPEYEDIQGGGQRLVRKADIFMIYERNGKDAKGRPVTLSPQSQLKDFGNAVTVSVVQNEDVHKVQTAEIEMRNRQRFEEEQIQLDNITKAEQIANVIEGESSEDANIRRALAEGNKIDEKAEARDIELFTQVKTPEELAAEKLKAGEAIVVEDDTPAAPVDSGGTGSRTVLS